MEEEIEKLQSLERMDMEALRAENEYLKMELAKEGEEEGSEPEVVEKGDSRSHALEAKLNKQHSQELRKLEEKFVKQHSEEMTALQQTLKTKHEKEIQELHQYYYDKYVAAYRAASLRHINDIIEPRDTRPVLIKSLGFLKGKKEVRPYKKHGNIPL